MQTHYGLQNILMQMHYISKEKVKVKTTSNAKVKLHQICLFYFYLTLRIKKQVHDMINKISYICEFFGLSEDISP